MIRNLVIATVVIGFFTLLALGASYKRDPATGKYVPIEHNVVTHEAVCITAKENYCYRYEVRRIVKE